ncbi:MAG: PEGA domain-containing protein [Acidobacteriia bacterium]|nr:PEGA domain-containing protein [Terriglobia bacterium]
MRRIFGFLVVSLLVLSAAAQSNDQKARVFITDSQSWQMTGNSGGANGAHGGHIGGGARPQTAEIIKTFGERCKEVVVNNKQDKADYTVVLDHEGGKSILSHDNKVAVFNSDGDAIVSHSTRSLGSSVKDACEAITRDWPSRVGKINAQSQQQPAQLMTVSQNSGDTSAASQISVSSMPGNADIEIDGSFVGSTPSAIDVTPGEHSVVVKKAGYKNWERTMKVSGGTINVSAELEKAQ